MSRPDLSLSASPAIPALSPSFRPRDSLNSQSHSRRPAQLTVQSDLPAASNLPAPGSSAQKRSPRNRSPYPPRPAVSPLPTYYGAWEPQSSSPVDRRTETNSFYATAWGSPYAVGSSRRPSGSLSELAGFGLESRGNSPDSTRSDSSRRSTEANTNLLKPFVPKKNSPPQPHNRDSSRSPSLYPTTGGRGGKSIRDFTKDWINQFLSGQQPRTERSNWLSDDSGSEGTHSFWTAENHYDEDLSDGWLGLESGSRDGGDSDKTPTLSDFVAGKRRNPSVAGKRPGRLEAKHERRDTVKQEDFWGFAYDRDPLPTTMSTTNNSQSVSEKPLPPVPPEPPALNPTESTNPNAARPPLEKSGGSISSRPRKKIPCRGKACIIALPLDDNRGSETSGYRLLTAEDVRRRLKEWEDQGYDTRGFSIDVLEDPSLTGIGGLSRPPYPDPVDALEEWKTGDFGVSFPNKAEWDAYVNYLQEEKLRALGVSLGDEEEEEELSVSPAVSQVLPQLPGLVATPPVPTASAGSHHLPPGHAFSPSFAHTANPSTGIGSLASPAPQFGVQTPFLGLDQNALAGYPFQFQPTPPAQGPLSPQIFNPSQPGAMPTIPGALPNLSSILSPVSPLNGGLFPPNPQKDPLEDPYGHNFYDGAADTHQQHSANQNPIDVSATPDNFRVSNVELAQPTPRGHDHNLSESLQKGLDQAQQPEYHLEKSIDRQLDEEEPNRNRSKSSGLMSSRWAMPADGGQRNASQNNPQQTLQPLYPNGYTEDYVQDNSDIDTNPSLAGTPQTPAPPVGLPWSHFQPPGADNSVFTFNSGGPSFNPVTSSRPSPNPNDDQNKPKSGSGFKFSSLQFNVDAPVFNPGGSVKSDADTEKPANADKPANDEKPAKTEEPPTTKSRIFGGFDLSQIFKPAKKSKAIPIVRPDDSENRDTKNRKSNERDRPAHGDRHKRARRSDETSNAEVKYSSSVHVLNEVDKNAPVSSTKSHPPAEGKENEVPGSDKGILNAEPAPATERNGTPASEASTFISEGQKAENNVNGVDSQEQKTELSSTGQNGRPTVHEKPLPPPPESSTAKDARNSELVSSAGDRVDKPNGKTVEGDSLASYSKPSDTPAPTENGVLSSKHSQQRVEAEHQKSQVAASKSGRASDSGTGNESLDREELNIIMDQLNGDSDIGIEREGTPRFVADQGTESAGHRSAAPSLVFSANRSPAPSPSPKRNRGSRMIPRYGSMSSIPPGLSKRARENGVQSTVQQLINHNEHISDWGDMISTSEDEKLANRSKFFGRRVNELDGGALEERLISLERTLGIIQQSMASMISKSTSRKSDRRALADFDGSDSDADADADDEDDEEENTSHRARPAAITKRDRKFDKLRAIIIDTLANHAPSPQQAVDPALSELAMLRENFSELKNLNVQQLTQDPTPNLKDALREVVSNQLDIRKSDAEEIGAESLMLQIDGLKNMLRLADGRAEEEYKLRREAQESVTELKMLLKIAEDDATRHCEAAESAETRFLQFKEEKVPYFEKLQFRTESLSNERETLQLTIAELSSKNIVLEGTLDEYRVSSEHWKRESEQVKRENKDLVTTIDNLKSRIDDSLSARQNLREKFDRLQNDMATAVRNLTRDQAAWQKREEEQLAKYDGLRATYGREVKLREKLEYDVNDLEKQEREGAKLKFIFGQSQQENARLEELVANLRLEIHDLEIKAARFEREFNEARESGRVEVQRTRNSFESDLDAANSQVNYVRSQLEAQIIRLQSHLDSFRLDADTARERYELLLEEAGEAKASAIAAVTESKETALAEQKKLHENAIRDIQERHAYALHAALEDQRRTEAHLTERLALSDEKVHHSYDRVRHLEERLEVANAAARAAARAAQDAKAGNGSTGPVDSDSASPSIPYRKGSVVPDKISPQALRESILVLQDQLQHRETRIDELEQQLSSVDKEAPTRLKEKDTEITWLRELLGVRIDDLQDIINTISQPSFDHNAVRDAAIRLRANLQMQEQERERALFGGPSFPSIPSSVSSSLASTPRALPLAAAAALGNLRKTKERISLNSQQALEQTPSKPGSAAGSFLSGLLTPPGSTSSRLNLGSFNAGGSNGSVGNRNPSAPASVELQPAQAPSLDSRPPKSYTPTPMRAVFSTRSRQARSTSTGIAYRPDPPKTPPLLRKASYDHDAEPADYDNGLLGGETVETVEENSDGGPGFGREGDSDQADVDDGLVSVSPKGVVSHVEHDDPVHS